MTAWSDAYAPEGMSTPPSVDEKAFENARCTDCLWFHESPYSPTPKGVRHGICYPYRWSKSAQKMVPELPEFVDDTELVRDVCTPSYFVAVEVDS